MGYPIGYKTFYPKASIRIDRILPKQQFYVKMGPQPPLFTLSRVALQFKMQYTSFRSSGNGPRILSLCDSYWDPAWWLLFAVGLAAYIAQHCTSKYNKFRRIIISRKFFWLIYEREYVNKQ